MSKYLKPASWKRVDRLQGGLCIVLIAVIITSLVFYFTSPASGQTNVQSGPSVVSTAEAPVPSASSASLTPLQDVTASPVPNLKNEVSSGGVRLAIPSIGFDEPLVSTEIGYDAEGNPILPNDVRVYMATNLQPKNCEVSGGDYILGHSTIYTEIWGDAPFNKFKALTADYIGQQFSIGPHTFKIDALIIQPKDALTSTKEFWCQPAGYVSIVACYTQDEDGDNVIVIGRPV